MTGRIRMWNRDRGFGFVRLEDRETGYAVEYFAHVRYLADAAQVPMKGDIVSFELGADRDGNEIAVNISIHTRANERHLVEHSDHIASRRELPDALAHLENKVLSGQVKRFYPTNERGVGFGFLIPAPGQAPELREGDLYFKADSVVNNERLACGDKVEFTLINAWRGLAAANVKLVARATLSDHLAPV